MITAALLLAGVIIDVSLLHWAIITVTVIAITAAICYHDVHVVVTMRMSFDVVVVSTLSSRRRYNLVDSLRLLSTSSRRRRQTTQTTSVVGRPTLSSFAVCRHSRNPLSCMSPRDYDVHMSWRVCLGPLSVYMASGYGYSSMTSVWAIFVTFVPA